MKRKKVDLLVAAILAIALLVPPGVLAAPAAALASALAGPAGPAGRDKNRLPAPLNQPVKPGLEFKQGEIIFKTTGETGDEASILRKYRLSVLRRDRRLGYILAAAPRETKVDKLAADLQRERVVRYAQPNYLYQLLGTPNDPQYARQWAMKKINAGQGWDFVKPGPAVIIAILDTGADVNHPDLINQLVPGVNTVNPLKSSRDDVGHGTHVAGVAAATVNNGLGVAGIAGLAGIKIMPVKVFDNSGGGNDISISDGITWAADHGARVMNMSFGSFYRSEVLSDAIEYAYKKGVLIAAASGNWASEEISYPAALSKVMAVTATDKQDKLAEFSSYGPLIDVCAPGVEIYSTFWDPYKGSTYTEMSGTSTASPMVAGLAALLLAKNPKLTNDEVRQIIEASAADLGDPGWDPRYGHGRIDVFKALTLSLASINDFNNTMAKAVGLQNGAAYQEKIDFGSDVDWYKIGVPDKNHLQVQLLPAGKVSPGLEIYSGSGELLSSFNTGSLKKDSREDNRPGFLEFDRPGNTLKVAEAVYGLVTNLDEGEYYIKVFGNHFRWSKENYSITARVITEADLVKDANEPNDSFEEAKNMSLNLPVSGAILSGDDEDWFKLDLTGKAYKIHLDVPAGLDLAVDVESAANYQEMPAGDNALDYYDNWYYENINEGGPGQDEDGVIVLPENGPGCYYIKVYETSGTAVNDSYILTITDFSLQGDRYEPNNTPDRAAPVGLGEEVTANFHSEEDEDWYELTVLATGILEIDLQQPQHAWYDLNLYSDPQAEPVGQGYYGDDSSWLTGEKRSFEYKVSTGKYYLSLRNYDRISGENYTLKTEFRSFDFIDREINDKPEQANEITLDNPARGTLYPAGDVDFYVLKVEKPQPLLVYLTPPADMDTMVRVMKETEPVGEEKKDGEGKKIEENQGEQEDSNSKASPAEPILELITDIESGSKGQPDTGVFIPTKPGKYYLMVTALAGKSQGRYSLSIKPFRSRPDAWEDNNTMAQAKPLTSGVSIRPTFMGTEDQDWYYIYVPARGRLEVNLSVPSDIDGVVEIYDSKARLLTKIDQSMVGEEEAATCPVPKRGYYYLRTYDYLGNSSVQPYTLTVKYWK